MFQDARDALGVLRRVNALASQDELARIKPPALGSKISGGIHGDTNSTVCIGNTPALFLADVAGPFLVNEQVVANEAFSLPGCKPAMTSPLFPGKLSIKRRVRRQTVCGSIGESARVQKTAHSGNEIGRKAVL